MSEKILTCPICNEDMHSYKVSQLYMEALMKIKHREGADTPTLDRFQNDVYGEDTKKFKGIQFYYELVSKFQPPQAGAPTFRAVNPDWVAVGVGLLSIYMLYQIYVTQYEVFWYMVGFALVACAVYIIFHKRFMTRYLTQKNSERSLKTDVENGIGRWMKLYYCTKDKVVFGDKKGHTIPLDQMTNYIMN